MKKFFLLKKLRNYKTVSKKYWESHRMNKRNDFNSLIKKIKDIYGDSIMYIILHVGGQ